MRINILIRDYSILLPFAKKLDELNSNLLDKSPQNDDKYIISKFGEDYVAEEYLGAKGIRYYTPQTRYLLSTILPLYAKNEIFVENEELGIVTASTFCSCEDFNALAKDIKKYNGYKGMMPGLVTSFSKNVTSSIASIKIKAQAFNVTFESTRSCGYNGLTFSLDSLITKDAKSIILSSVEHIDECVEKLISLSSKKEKQKKIGNGAVSILLDTNENLPSKGKILCYRESFINTMCSIDVIVQIVECINETIKECEIEFSEIGLLITDIHDSNFDVQSLELVLQDFFPKAIKYSSLDEIGNYFSINSLLNIIIACELLSNGIPESILEKEYNKNKTYNNKKYSFIIGIDSNGIINTQIIKI